MNSFFLNKQITLPVMVFLCTVLLSLLLPVTLEISGQDQLSFELTSVSAEDAPGATPPPEEPSQIAANTQIPELCGFRPKTFLVCIGEWGLGLTGYMLSMSGKFFNYMLLLTLDTALLGASVAGGGAVTYIQEIWSNIRDMANLGFIFALLFIAFSLIFSWKAQQAKSLFVRVVIIALLLNFSLFISKVIIDAGNITAMTFYNAMTDPTPIDEDSDSGALATLFGPAGHDKKGVSGAIAQGVNPTKALTPDVFISMRDANGGNPPYGTLAFLYLTISAVTFMLAKEMIIAGFMFVSRTVWLIVLMVISPLAFVSYLFPPTQKYFTQWFTQIVDRSFCVVIFLFFIWLLIQIVGGMNSVFGNEIIIEKWTNILLIMIIQFGITFSILKMANAQTLKRCDGGGGLGAALVKGAKMTAGAGLMVATGGAGVVARNQIGGRAFRAVSGESKFGQMVNKAAQEGKMSGVVTRRALQVVSGQKFGTTAGYKERRDRDADKRFNEANELENLNKKRFEEDYKKRNASEVGAGKKYRDQTELDRVAKDVGLRESRRESTETLRKRAGIAPTDGRPNDIKKRGVFGRTYETVTAGWTDATGEAYKRRVGAVKKDVEKKEKQQQIKDAREKRAYDNNRLDQENRRAAAASAAVTKKAIIEGDTTAAKLSDALVNTDPNKNKGEMGALAQSFAKEIKNEDGSRTYQMDAQTKEMFEQVTTDANTELQRIAEEASERERAAQETLIKNEGALSEQNNILSKANDEIGLLQDILRDMENNNNQAELSEVRRVALRAADIEVADDATVTKPEHLVALKDKVREKTTTIDNASNRFSALQTQVATSTQNLQDIRIDTAKQVDEVYNSVTKVAKDRLKARSEAQNSIDTSSMIRSEGAALEFQKQAGDIESFEQKAFETDGI